MSSMRQRSRELAQQLASEIRANTRLAALLLLVPAVVLVHLTLLTRDSSAQARSEHAALMRRAERLEALAQGGDWEQHHARERELLATWEEQLWRSSSPELVAADLQTVLQRIAAEHLSWNRLKLSPPERIEAFDGWSIRAELNGKLKQGEVLGMLQALAQHSPRIRIDQIDVSQQRGQTVNLRLGVFVTPEQELP